MRIRRFLVVLVGATGVFVVAWGLSRFLWHHHGASLAAARTGGLTFFVPWAIALAVAAWRSHALRPRWQPTLPTRGGALAFAGALVGIWWLYRGQINQALSVGLHWPPLTLAFFSGVFLGPAVEEHLFRGLLWNALVPDDPARPLVAIGAVTATSIAFALWHLPFNPNAPLVLHGIFGALVAVVRWRTRSLLPGFVLHAAANTLYFVV